MLHVLILLFCFLREFLDLYSKLSIDLRSLLLYFLSPIIFMVLCMFLVVFFYSLQFSVCGFITFSSVCMSVADRLSWFWFALVFDAIAFPLPTQLPFPTCKCWESSSVLEPHLSCLSLFGCLFLLSRGHCVAE